MLCNVMNCVVSNVWYPIYQYFNLPGHSLADLTVRILEQTKIQDEDYRLEKENYFIRKFNTFKGINREW